MRRIFSRAAGVLLLAALSLSALLPGCAKNTSIGSRTPAPGNTANAVKTNVAMGRYLETSLELPQDDLNPIIAVNADGTLTLYNTVNGKTVCYSSADGSVWKEADVGALGGLSSEEKSPSEIVGASREGGALYVLYRDAEEKPHIVKSENGGALTEIAVEDWAAPAASAQPEGGAKKTPDAAARQKGDAKKTPDASAKQDGAQQTPAATAQPEEDKQFDMGVLLSYPQLISALSGGDVLVGYYNQVIRYDAAGKKLQTYEGTGSIFTVFGNTLFLLSKDQNSIESVDIGTGNIIRSVPVPTGTAQSGFTSYSSEGSILAVDNEGALYLADSKGVHRLAPGGSLWETVVDGELTSMCIPSLHVSDLRLDQKGGYYVTLIDDKGAHLMHYVYSADTPSVPGVELSIYALSNNDTVRQAIGEYQREHPDVKVTFRYGLTEDMGLTQADVVRILNAELLAGKGPDILLLDGLPVESYIQKGVLMDLSAALRPQLDQKTLLQNIVDCYTRDGKIYALPVRIAFPLMLGKQEAVESATTLHGLVEAVVAQSGSRSYLAANTPKGRVAEFFLTSAPAFQKADGTLDTAKLAEFLTDVKTIGDACGDNYAQTQAAGGASGSDADKPKPDELGFQDGGFMGLLALRKGDVQLHMQMLRGFTEYSIPVAIKDKLDNGKFAVMGGQSEGIFVPCGLVGINSASKQRDLAASFVQSLFGDSVQSANLGDGFPINNNAIDKEASQESNGQTTFSVSIVGNDEGTISGGVPSKENLALCAQMLRSLHTPAVTDSVLLEMIQNEYDAFFAGEKTAEQTAAAIAERTQAYLSE